MKMDEEMVGAVEKAVVQQRRRMLQRPEEEEDNVNAAQGNEDTAQKGV